MTNGPKRAGGVGLHNHSSAYVLRTGVKRLNISQVIGRQGGGRFRRDENGDTGPLPLFGLHGEAIFPTSARYIPPAHVLRAEHRSGRRQREAKERRWKWEWCWGSTYTSGFSECAHAKTVDTPARRKSRAPTRGTLPLPCIKHTPSHRSQKPGSLNVPTDLIPPSDAILDPGELIYLPLLLEEFDSVGLNRKLSAQKFRVRPPSDGTMHDCPYCDHFTQQPSNLKMHIDLHINPTTLCYLRPNERNTRARWHIGCVKSRAKLVRKSLSRKGIRVQAITPFSNTDLMKNRKQKSAAGKRKPRATREKDTSKKVNKPKKKKQKIVHVKPSYSPARAPSRCSLVQTPTSVVRAATAPSFYLPVIPPVSSLLSLPSSPTSVPSYSPSPSPSPRPFCRSPITSPSPPPLPQPICVRAPVSTSDTAVLATSKKARPRISPSLCMVPLFPERGLADVPSINGWVPLQKLLASLGFLCKSTGSITKLLRNFFRGMAPNFYHLVVRHLQGFKASRLALESVSGLGIYLVAQYLKTNHRAKAPYLRDTIQEFISVTHSKFLSALGYDPVKIKAMIQRLHNNPSSRGFRCAAVLRCRRLIIRSSPSSRSVSLSMPIPTPLSMRLAPSPRVPRVSHSQFPSTPPIPVLPSPPHRLAQMRPRVHRVKIRPPALEGGISPSDQAREQSPSPSPRPIPKLSGNEPVRRMSRIDLSTSNTHAVPQRMSTRSMFAISDTIKDASEMPLDGTLCPSPPLTSLPITNSFPADPFEFASIPSLLEMSMASSASSSPLHFPSHHPHNTRSRTKPSTQFSPTIPSFWTPPDQTYEAFLDPFSIALDIDLE